MLPFQMNKIVSRPKLISVFGGRIASEEQYHFAFMLGKAIAKHQWILLCGGRGGIMEAVSKGCSEEGGTVIGILPGTDHSDVNAYVNIPIATGIGLARNEILACACDVAVAIGGKYGTLSEIGHALQYEKPVISLKSWGIKGSHVVNNVEEAILKLEELLT
jgi:hypothetical protein